MRGVDARIADVRALVRAARRVARDEALVPEIARCSGLSVQGVRLALERHLELTPSDEEVEALALSVVPSPRVHVILSATVFTAALRAIAVARAAAPKVSVRPSRRDPVFARALVGALADPTVTLADADDIDSGEIHVYGRDETIAEVSARAQPRVIVRAHGAGLGVAYISRSGTLERAAEALARDVVPFDQRGCLSPRVAFVEGDEARAERFAAALDAALSEAGASVARGELSVDERTQSARYIETVVFAGRCLRGADHVVGVASSLVVPPPGRHVHVVPVRDARDVRAHLQPMERRIVAFGADDVLRLEGLAPSHARVSGLGEMQRPPFDGPVDRRWRLAF
jgi:acyl-CoA reductase LuxC